MNNQFNLPTALVALVLTLGSYTTLLGQCAEGQSQVVVEILTDNFPQEITWTLSDANGQLMSGGPYGESGTLYADTSCIDVSGETSCLQFVITDGHGDGICCGSWPFGYYNIYLDGEVVATGGQYGQQDLVYIACETGDCSSYMTLSSSPSGCDASGSVTADVTQCSASISGGSWVMQHLYEGLSNFSSEYCLDGDYSMCENLGPDLSHYLASNGVGYYHMMDEIQAFAPSPVMQALYDALNNPLSEFCLGYEPNLCENLGLHLSYKLSSTGVSYLDLMNEIQAFAVGVETSDCIVSWSDSTGNSVGEGFSLSGLAAGTYTASLNHSNGCTDTQTIEVLLECNGCTHENASNYNSTATIEDGSCLYSQETHDAGYEAGAASVECPPCANSDCPGDFTADGYIGVDDILAMLSLYDTSCSE